MDADRAHDCWRSVYRGRSLESGETLNWFLATTWALVKTLVQASIESGLRFHLPLIPASTQGLQQNHKQSAERAIKAESRSDSDRNLGAVGACDDRREQLLGDPPDDRCWPARRSIRGGWFGLADELPALL
jgi:hypothetical protein